MPAVIAAMPIPAGLLIAFGEVAAGLGALCDLFTRAASATGMLLSLSFFLTRPG